jgi:hypothetical protein
MLKHAARPVLLIRVAMFVTGLMTMPALATETASPIEGWATANGHGVVPPDHAMTGYRQMYLDVRNAD